MKKVLSLILALVLVLSLAGCGGDKKMVGKWVSEYELKNVLDSKIDASVEAIDSRLLSTVYENLRAAYEGLSVKEVLQINDDNTYVLYFDTGNAKSIMDEKIRDIVTNTIKEDKYGSRLSNDYVNSLVNDIIEGMDFEKAFSNTVEGEYKIDGDKFYFDKDDTTFYGVFTIEGDKLSFSEINGISPESESSYNVLVREFTKASDEK